MTIFTGRTTQTDTADGHDNDVQSGFNNSLTTLAMQSSASNSARFNTMLSFPNVTVPQGSTIDSATLTLIEATGGAVGGVSDVYGEDVDDGNIVVNSASITGALATKTTATAVLTVALGTNVLTITSIIQELVDRPGFVSGNRMTIITEGRTSPSASGTVRSGDNASESLRPLLTINFTEPATPGSGGPQSMIMQQVVAGLL